MAKYGTNPTVGIRLQQGRLISVYKGVLRGLGYPPYLQFWWSAKEGALVLTPCVEQLAASIAVGEGYYANRNGFRVANRPLYASICHLLGVGDRDEVKLHGDKFLYQRMFVFRLEDRTKTEVETYVQ
jgi:hypothetical protein